MAYRAFIRHYIDKALNMLQDIPKIVVFKKRGGRVFDFTTAKASKPFEQSIRVKVVILEGERRDKDVNIIFKKMLLRHDLIATVCQYDVVDVDGIEWNVGDVVRSEVDFVAYLEIFKEASDTSPADGACTCPPIEGISAIEIASIFNGEFTEVINKLIMHSRPIKSHKCECTVNDDVTFEEIQAIISGTIDELLPNLYENIQLKDHPCRCLPFEDVSREEIQSLFEGGD